MADSKQTKNKRRLRAPAETVREKAVRTQEAAGKPNKRHKIRRGFGVLLWPFRQVFRLLAWLSHKPPLKQIGHAFRWFFSRRPIRFLGKITGIILLAGYFAGSWRELKRVNWPSAKQSRQLTTAVVVFSIIFGSLIALVDFGLDKLFKQVILKG